MGLSLISHVSLLVSLFAAFTKLQDQNTVTVIPTRGHLGCTVKKISQKRPSAVPWAPFCLAWQEAADRADQRVLQTAEQWLVQAA